MTPDEMAVVHHVLTHKCATITFRPKENLLGQLGLTAWRDDLGFTPKSIELAVELMDIAVEALRARFRFGRAAHEMDHGPCEIFAEEFMAIFAVDPTTNQRTGEVQIHAQMILRQTPPLTDGLTPPKP